MIAQEAKNVIPVAEISSPEIVPATSSPVALAAPMTSSTPAEAAEMTPTEMPARTYYVKL